jgi:hypothetical protein
VRSARHLIAGLLLLTAAVVGGYGVWVMATRDVQGGRHEAGAFLLAIAFASLIASLLVLRMRRRT